MNTVTLGRTGITTSRLGFGSAGLMRQGTARERVNLLAAAFESGITHYDTAPIYGLGQSERLLGQFARGRRASITVTTKFGLGLNRMGAAVSGVQSVLRRVIGASPALRRAVKRRAERLYKPPAFAAQDARVSLESSLRRLRMEYVDLLLLHDCSLEATISEDLLQCLESLRHKGMVRAFGIATAFRHARPFQAVYPALCKVIQFDSDILTRNGSRFAGNETGCGLVTHSVLTSAFPLLRAMLASEPQVARRWSDALELDVTDGTTLGNLLIGSALAENSCGPTLVHTSSVDHMRANARAAEQVTEPVLVRFAELVAERFGGLGAVREIPASPRLVIKGGLGRCEQQA